MKTRESQAPGSADIVFELDGEEVTLKPTLQACIAISKLHDNPTITAGQITDMNFDVIVRVLGIALNRAPNKLLQEQVYRTGVLDIRAPLIQFVHVVNNGGRPVTDTDAEDDKTEDDKGN